MAASFFPGLLGARRMQNPILGAEAPAAPPAGLLSGLLGQGPHPVANWLGDRSAALLGVGLPMMLTKWEKDVGPAVMAGLQGGQQIDYARGKDKREQERIAKQEAALAKALSTYGIDAGFAADPDTARTLLAAKLKPPERQGIVNAGDGNLYDPTTGKWITAPQQPGASGMFPGKSVDATALNYLVSNGTLTPQQAADIAAGKPFIGPQGEQYFFKPSDIANGMNGPQLGAGPAQLTGPKPPSETVQRSLQASNLVEPELPIVEENFTALGSLLDQAGNAAGGLVGLEGFATSEEYQRAKNALIVIAQQNIYSQSGASAPDAEVERIATSLMPVPGEKPKSRADKLRRIRTMVNGIRLRANLPALPEKEAGGVVTMPDGNVVERVD